MTDGALRIIARRPRPRPLAQQAIVITGASSGIGLATAREAARRGARVLLVARNGEALSAACEAVRAEGGTAEYAVADVGDPDQVAAVRLRAEALFGRFDTWVNAAGVAIYAWLLETPLDEHERLFRTDYWGVVHGSSAAVAHFKSRPGAGVLVNVGSVVSDIGTPILGAYAAAKHAVKGFSDSLRIELIAQGAPVSVTLIKPSGIGTPLAQHAANHLDGEARIPPTPYAPELVAEAILRAARRPKREITVGGVGKLQTLVGVHLPGLADRVSPAIIPLLVDRRRRKTPGQNLFAPMFDGRTRSAEERSREFSLRSLVQQRPLAVSGVVLAGGLLLTALRRSRR